MNRKALVILALVVLLPTVTAEVSSNPGNRGYCREIPNLKVAGVIEAGIMSVCVWWEPDFSDDDFRVGVDVQAPPVNAGGSVTIVVVATSLDGCTAGAGAGDLQDSGLQSNLATGISRGIVQRYDMVGVSGGCSGVYTVTIQGLTVLMAVAFTRTFELPFQVHETWVDNQNRFCASSDFKTSCTTPTVNLAGTLALSGSLTLNGIPDTQQEIQAIADALAAGLDVTICPQVAPCYHVLSGAVNTPDVATELDEYTAAFCPGPTHGHCDLHLHGDIEVNPDEACGAVTPCQSQVSGVEVAIGNASFNTTFPESFEVTNPTSDFWVPVFLWAVAIIIFLWVAKLLAAGASTIGFVFALLGNTELQVLALVILGVALWLEASARERIYARWFRKRFEAKQAEGRRTTGT